VDWSCPAPQDGASGVVTLAVGEGGRLSRKFLREHILDKFCDPCLGELGDAAVLPTLEGSPVLTTDSFVVSPLEFPGGNIGKLAAYGTANDLAVAGARPKWMSVALVLEEGLPLELLDRMLLSLRDAAVESGVVVVAGDTKVVPRGAADRLFITTTGLGERLSPAIVGPRSLVEDDVLIVTGPIGQHGFAVLAARSDLQVQPPPQSDCAALWPAVESLWKAGVTPRAMRDATRGGVAAVLHEWAIASGKTLSIESAGVPTTPAVSGLSELLGIDPLHVANEGTMLVAVPASLADATLAALRSTEVARHSVVIGRVEKRGFSPVTVRRALGRAQPLDDPAGAPLPRIC